MRSHQALAELAGRQHGVVSFRQLRKLGFSKGAIARSSEAFRLCRVHRGVYAVGQRGISQHGRCMAAILACDEGSVLSHISAAWLWGLIAWFPREVHVSTEGRSRRRHGIRVHRIDAITADWGWIERIPVTDLSRTLLHVAATEPPKRLAGVVDRAARLELLDLDAIDGLIDGCRRAPGVARLREAVDLYRGSVVHRARSELLFLALIKQEGLPRPAINTWVEKYEIDAYWEDLRFAVEVDGWDTHRTRKAFEVDPVRVEDLKLAGIDAIRITARRIELHPAEVGRRLRAHLARRRRELSR
jgi:hypothetical protein